MFTRVDLNYLFFGTQDFDVYLFLNVLVSVVHFITHFYIY